MLTMFSAKHLIKLVKTNNMDFSKALVLLKQGAVIRRASWSGTKRIFLMAGSTDLEILPYIGIVTKDGKFGVYTATNCDILADDWMRYC